jgi:4-hydroxy-tetrahydrodipicolinate reductase
MRILVIGAGKMGRAVEALARANGHEVCAVLASADNAEGAGIREHAEGADVAIEFTAPDAALANVRACIGARLPVVVGTTGWYEHLASVEAEARAAGAAVLTAPNFSLGVALVMEISRAAGAAFAAHPQYGAALLETHHSAKKDAPSGTAKLLAESVREALGRDLPVTSVRVGSVPGTHTLIFDGPFEQIVISHEARDRRVFADGALHAAQWLIGRTGVFTMRDVIANPRP